MKGRAPGRDHPERVERCEGRNGGEEVCVEGWHVLGLLEARDSAEDEDGGYECDGVFEVETIVNG